MRARKSESSTAKPSKARGENARAYPAVERDRLRQEVELKAYYNFLDRQQYNKPGNELSDWLEAEKDVSKSISRSS